MKLLNAVPFAVLILAPCLVSAQTVVVPRPAGAGAARERATGPQWLAPDADTQKTLQQGLIQAGNTHRRMAVMYQGAWCDLCGEVTDAVHSDPDLQRLTESYLGLPIEVPDAAAVEAFARKVHAAWSKDHPLLITVLNPDGTVLTAIGAARITDAGHVAPAKLKAVLNEFVLGAAAEQVFANSLPALAGSGKLGWVEFRADWCGWCKKMEKLFHDSDAAPILAKYYSVIAVDTEKNDGSEQLARRLGSVNGVDGIPWFAVIDATGKVLATSEGPKGNIGFPDTDVEVAHFFSVLHDTAKGMTQEEIAVIHKALKAT